MQIEIPPWMEKLQQPPALIGGLGLIVLLLLALIFVMWRWGISGDRFEMLEKRAAEGFIQAPSSTRTVRIDLREPRLVGIDAGGLPQRIDLLINARTDRYARFRVSLLRDDGTLILHADQMVRDSNYDLRLSFNSSVLPNAKYRLQVDGYARGGLERFAEAQLQVAGR